MGEANDDKPLRKAMQMGLGEAVQRLLQVETLRSRGLVAVPAQARAECDLIFEALNTIKLDLGFDCNADGIPDTVQIFAKSAETSCCRLMPVDTSRKTTATSSRRSRKKKADETSAPESEET